jgi:hypothetical protein
LLINGDTCTTNYGIEEITWDHFQIQFLFNSMTIKINILKSSKGLIKTDLKKKMYLVKILTFSLYVFFFLFWQKDVFC